MRNSDYAALLESTAHLLEITGGNRFKVRAFERAARTVKRYPGDINDLI